MDVVLTEVLLVVGVIVGSLGAGLGLAHVALSGVFALLPAPVRVEAMPPKTRQSR
jgi:hypothetical protein